MARIGVSPATRDELERHGLSSLEDLEALDNDGIKSLANTVMRFPHPDRPNNVRVYLGTSCG